MDALTPGQSAMIASGVYLLQRRSVTELRENRQTLGCEGLFAVDDGSRFKGASGMAGFKQISGFGYIAAGEGSVAGDVLIATRGTMGAKLGPDWMSNYNVGMQIGPGGLPVHAGFHEIWKTIAPAIHEFLRGRNPGRIHCVGHSLGGALATLTADMLSSAKVAGVSLYTFGSPRVGDGFFSRSLTQRMTGADGSSIYRVYHPADPVPMIPLFPFWHLPAGAHLPVRIANDIHNLISADAHSMEDSYEKAVMNQSWRQLRSAAMARADEQQQVKSWLGQAAEGRGGLAMGSAKVLSMIGRALAWLLAAAGKLVANTVSASLTAGLTVLDQLAWLLTQAAHLCQEVGIAIKGLIGAIFGFLGRKTVQAADVTAAFLRWVLELLFVSLRTSAQRAIALASRVV